MTDIDIRVHPGDWGETSADDIAAVLRSAAAELGRHVDWGRLTIDVTYDPKLPLTEPARGPEGQVRVHLAARDRAWSQFAYQFAHELCHVLAGSPDYGSYYKENPNQWFEETLCEAAALFVLRAISETWTSDPPFPNWAAYAPKLLEYGKRTLDAVDLPKGRTLGEVYRCAEPFLRRDSGQRFLNRMLARPILAILERSPGYWGAVRYLNANQDPTRSFARYLRDWSGACPDQKDFVGQVAGLFEIEAA